MNCKIDTTPDFARELKQLAKRYPSMKDDWRNMGLVPVSQKLCSSHERKKLL